MGAIHSRLATVTLGCIMPIRMACHAPPCKSTLLADEQWTAVPNICNYTAAGVLKGAEDELHRPISYTTLVESM